MEVGVITDSSGEQSCISFWDLSTGVLIKSFKNGSCGRNGIGFVGNDYITAAQYGKQLIHVYDTQKEQSIKKIVCPGKISALAVSPDGNYCIVALLEKIYIWQICTGNLINVLLKHYQNITCIKFTHDGAFFLTCGEDNLLLVWNFASILQPKESLINVNTYEQPIHTLSQHSMAIQGVYVGSGGMRCHAVTCSLDQTCKVYDVSSGQLLCSFIFDVACTAVTMDVCETRMFTGTLDGKIYFINCYSKKNEEEVHVGSDKSSYIKAHSKEINSLSVCMDSTKLLSGSLDCFVKLWHIQSKQCLRTFSFKGEITNASIIPFPGFLQENIRTSKLKCPVENFKRTIYIPGEHSDLSTVQFQSDDVLPVILKDIDSECLSSCILKDDEEAVECPSYYDQVMLEFGNSDHTSSNSNSLKTATRSELLQRVAALQTMAQEFYTLASDKLLKDIHSSNDMESG